MRLPSMKTLYWTMVILLFLEVILGIFFDTHWKG